MGRGVKSRTSKMLPMMIASSSVLFCNPLVFAGNLMVHNFDIPPSSLGDVLTSLATQSDNPLLFPFDDVTHIQSEGIVGAYTLDAALDTLLTGTHLAAQITDEGVVMIVAAASSTETTEEINVTNSTKKGLFGGVAAAVVAAVSQGAVAQPDDEIVEDTIVVTGTRVEGKDPSQTISPVDVFDAGRITNQGQFDLTNQLTNIAPSLNTQRFPIADGTALVRPVTLRNLAPDQTLVLVNGRRRHRSALVNLQFSPLGTINNGSQAVDFGIIPAAAIGRLEILRDGASAQYGSDAIAGVINIILDDSSEGINLTAQYGQRYQGDGENFRISGNIGLPLTDNGYFNATAEYVTSSVTFAGSPRLDAVDVGNAIGFDQVPLDGFGQRFGDPDVEGFRLFFNSAIEVADNGTEIYGHGSYADQQIIGDFFYRSPFGIPGVTPNGALAQVETDIEGNTVFDPVTGLAIPITTPQSVVDAIIADGLDPTDFLLADATSPSGFINVNPIALQFPGGFTPTFGADVRDFEGVVGVRGEKGGLSWDFAGRFGENEIVYDLSSAINPTLGATSPTTFEPGTLTQRELGVNADFVYAFETGNFASPLNFAFGAEYRRETYEIGVGDAGSTAVGPTTGIFTPGSDGFQGFFPSTAGDFRIGYFAGYADVEVDVTDQLSFGVAGRYEGFSEFDGGFTWKVSGRYDFTDRIALRATANTGFRAPTPGQLSTTNLTTSADSAGNLIPAGTFAVTGASAAALGAGDVSTEESFSYTVGLALNPLDNVSFTIDYYNIDVEDRIRLINFSAAVPAANSVLESEGFFNVGLAQVFQNAFDSNVQGIDIALTADFSLGQLGDLSADLRHNWHELEVTNSISAALSDSEIFDFENQVPNHRSTLTFNYTAPERFGGFIRLNRFGGFADSGGLFAGVPGSPASFGSEWLVDVEARAKITENFSVAAGGENVFNNFADPEQNAVLNFLGATTPITSPFGINGGFWYLRLQAEF